MGTALVSGSPLALEIVAIFLEIMAGGLSTASENIVELKDCEDKNWVKISLVWYSGMILR